MPSMSLKSLLEIHAETMKRTHPVLMDCPWENREFYACWCAQSYYFVAHATRILAASAARLHLDRDSVHIRFLDHSQEEKHHEKLYAKDLGHLGKQVSDFHEHPLTSFLYQSQYYLLDYQDPIAPMGGIFFLEGVSVYSGTPILERCLKAHGSQACTFLKVHIHDDQDHLQKAEMILGGLSEKEMAVVATSYQQFSYSYLQLMKELCRQLEMSLSAA